MNPVLLRRGKEAFLVFAKAIPKVKITKPVRERIICAVDLGMNTAATCTIMKPDGKIVDTKFIKFNKERRNLNNAYKRTKYIGSEERKKRKAHFRMINALMKDISSKTARDILQFAINHQADVIVIEDLKFNQCYYSYKNNLSLWDVNRVIEYLINRANNVGIAVEKVFAANTSRLAYDEKVIYQEK